MPAQFPKAGPTGPAGGTPYSEDVTVPSDEITVVHSLGRTNVLVHCYGEDATEIEVGVEVLDENSVRITTVPELAFSGKVVVF